LSSAGKTKTKKKSPKSLQNCKKKSRKKNLESGVEDPLEASPAVKTEQLKTTRKREMPKPRVRNQFRSYGIGVTRKLAVINPEGRPGREYVEQTKPQQSRDQLRDGGWPSGQVRQEKSNECGALREG